MLPSVPDLIEKLFEDLENNYGRITVSTALRLISVSSKGLSQMELEDLLSCDNDVLREVYSSGGFEDRSVND